MLRSTPGMMSAIAFANRMLPGIWRPVRAVEIPITTFAPTREAIAWAIIPPNETPPTASHGPTSSAQRFA